MDCATVGTFLGQEHYACPNEFIKKNRRIALNVHTFGFSADQIHSCSSVLINNKLKQSTENFINEIVIQTDIH